MSLTLHDFRVQLRDKTRVCQDLEEKVSTLTLELDRRDKLVREKSDVIKKKDDIITIKEHIIQEKDTQILKLQKELETSSSRQENGKVLTSLTNRLQKPEANATPYNIPKSKRIAISAESTHNRVSSKEPRGQLVAYPKKYQ